MSKATSVDVGIFHMGGYDIRGFSTMFTYNFEAMTEEAHVLGDSWVYHDTVRVTKSTMEQSGFFTTEEAGANQASGREARIGTDFRPLQRCRQPAGPREYRQALCRRASVVVQRYGRARRAG
ncbi:MAG: hypothetical protein IPG34_20095 [Rhodocyclaceae bacterium]|nr:hypothetical protein [Rhodocyclaceae bacterium]